MLKRLSSLIIFLTLITTSNVFADQIQIGERLPDVEFLDQHDQSHRLDSTVQLLIFAHTKEAGSMMTDILSAAEPDHLNKRNAVYIADVSGMPSLIARFFALPKMRKIGSPIYLSRDAEQTAWLPKKDEKLTLLKLTDGLIENISFTEDKETLNKILEVR